MFNATTRRSAPGLVFMVLSIGVMSAFAAAPTSIEVSAPDCDYRDCPVSVEVTAPASAKSATLTDAKGNLIVAQVWGEGDKAMLTWILPELKKGSSATYKVAFSDAAPAGSGVVIRKGDEGADVTVGGAPFTRYITAGAPKPYCYPVLDATGGAQVTRDFPMKDVEIETKLKDRDHPHQRSLWFTHGSVNGIDFWSEGPKAGKTVHRAFEALDSGPVMGRLCAVTDWMTPDGKKVCEDARDIRFYKVAQGRFFDWNITVKATEEPVKFGDTKEGMFGFRVASTMKVDAKKMDPKLGGKIVNAEGLTDSAAWGKQSNWVDYYGPVGDRTVGIAVLDHPTSFRHPTYWHVRTYGLFAANPFGVHDFPDGKGKDGSHTIEKGGSITFKYRILIHDGTTEAAKIADVYQQYATPPKVTVQ